MTAPTVEHCNLCRREVYICASCGKPSCMAGRTPCKGCEKARALDDARPEPEELQKATA